jgi:hypothetical protein
VFSFEDQKDIVPLLSREEDQGQLRNHDSAAASARRRPQAPLPVREV